MQGVVTLMVFPCAIPCFVESAVASESMFIAASRPLGERLSTGTGRNL